MTFPDGRIKDGYFDNNVFKGKTEIEEGSKADQLLKEENNKYLSSSESPLKVQAAAASQEAIRSSATREPRELRIKTRGGSNSVRRSNLNDSQVYSTNQQNSDTASRQNSGTIQLSPLQQKGIPTK
mmetsp:Transcript_24223/g.37326  ORF Transcript_24223/g.37326 Transcript_24223/m.37326 type:complete len:126 (+) Transcript_24223:1554-1931(+)